MKMEQKIVAAGAATGVLTMAVSVWILTRLLPAPAIGDAPGERLAYALLANVIALVPFFTMLITVSNARFLSEAIDPTLHKENPRMIVDGRVADNTTQQFLLFLAGSLALAAALPAERLTIVGAAAITFLIVRLAFWWGYRIHPLYRAFGFASTAYLNLGMLVAALWLAMS